MLPLRKYTALALPAFDDTFFQAQAQNGAQWAPAETGSHSLKWLIPSGWLPAQVEGANVADGFSTLAAARAEDDSGAMVLRWSPCPTPVDPGDFLDAAIPYTATHACAYQRDHGAVAERSVYPKDAIRTDTALWTPAGLFWFSGHSASTNDAARNALRILGHTIIFTEAAEEGPERVKVQSKHHPIAWSQSPETNVHDTPQNTELTFGSNGQLQITVSPIDPAQGPARAINTAMVQAHQTHGRLVPGTLQQLELTWPESQWSDKVRIRCAKSPSNREVVLIAGTVGEDGPILIEAHYPAREADTFAWLAARKELTEVVLSMAPAHRTD